MFGQALSLLALAGMAVALLVTPVCAARAEPAVVATSPEAVPLSVGAGDARSGVAPASGGCVT